MTAVAQEGSLGTLHLVFSTASSAVHLAEERDACESCQQLPMCAAASQEGSITLWDTRPPHYLLKPKCNQDKRRKRRREGNSIQLVGALVPRNRVYVCCYLPTLYAHTGILLYTFFDISVAFVTPDI
ncbi:hypothetical protein TSMEX_001850 [Taenia solium]|eukprot:TsM_000363800 transcript=TsM_000363800 gene=TsM_000363800